MTINDPIADFLTRIRNGQKAKHRFVDIRLSKMKRELAQILKDQGFVTNFIIDESKGLMRIFLKYNAKRNGVIHGLTRISKPGLRKYTPAKSIPKVRNGMGIAILSTSRGVFEGSKAKQEKVGGEILCHIW